MKKILVLFALTGCLMACKSSHKNESSSKNTGTTQETPKNNNSISGVKVLDGYFLKNTVHVNGDMDLVVIKDQAMFESYFGMGKTMTNQIIKPDFTTSIVAAVLMKPVETSAKIFFEDIKTSGSEMNIYVTVNKGEAQSFTMTPTSIINIQKQKGISKATLYVNNQKTKTVSF